MAEGSTQQASELLERLRQAAEAQDRMGSVIEISIVQALAHQAQGNTPAALAALDRALTLAEPEGYVRIFVDEGEAMRLLIADFRVLIEKQKRGEESDRSSMWTNFSRPFRNRWRCPNQQHLHARHRQRSSAGVSNIRNLEPLSPRELEVLRLIAQGFSNQEIADRLFLAAEHGQGAYPHHL